MKLSEWSQMESLIALIPKVMKVKFPLKESYFTVLFIYNYFDPE